MRLLRYCLAVFAVAAAAASPAQAEPRLVLSLSASQVQIGSNYTGAQLVLFGVIEDGRTSPEGQPYDVVVTVRGPRETVSVRRKDPVGPIWINRAQQKFAAVPSVLIVLSSRPVGEIASPAVRQRYRLGLDAIVGAPEITLGSDVGADFRGALVRILAEEGLWGENRRGVTWVTPTFFRAPVPLSGTAPTGNYEVEAVLLSRGSLVARRSASFEVVKTGFEERITALAEQHSLLYGLGIGALSLAFGWLASVIFRRD